jgi:hypothetical protein
MAFSFLHVFEQRIGMSFAKYSFSPVFPGNGSDRLHSTYRHFSSRTRSHSTAGILPSCRGPESGLSPAAPTRRNGWGIAAANAIPS